jgi:hypothetical protein
VIRYSDLGCKTFCHKALDMDPSGCLALGSRLVGGFGRIQFVFDTSLSKNGAFASNAGDGNCIGGLSRFHESMCIQVLSTTIDAYLPGVQCLESVLLTHLIVGRLWMHTTRALLIPTASLPSRWSSSYAPKALYCGGAPALVLFLVPTLLVGTNLSHHRLAPRFFPTSRAGCHFSQRIGTTASNRTSAICCGPSRRAWCILG